VLYGLIAPFAAAFMERFGIRRTVATALVVVGVASALTLLMTQPWQLWLLWGVFIGIGTGAMALVLGAIVANRWFHTHRGLVTGIFSAASATGQLLFLPLIARTAVDSGWRAAAGIVSVLALLMAVLVVAFLRDRPSDHGLLPYGMEPGSVVVEAELSGRSPARVAIDVLRKASRRWSFWALVLTFWVCGWSTNGIIQTHFVPAAHDHGMPSTTAAGLLAVVGIFDIAGTVFSGWLTDRYDPRVLLLTYYGLRGLSLFYLPFSFVDFYTMTLFAVFYGLDWFATVSPTVRMLTNTFGRDKAPLVYGWVFTAHQLGGASAAVVAGLLRVTFDDYMAAFMLSGALCLVAAVAALFIGGGRRAPEATATPVAVAA